MNNFESESDTDSCTTSVTHSVTDSLSGLSLYDVICGRHKEAFNWVGNRRFRVTVSLNTERYIKTPKRKGKSDVIKCIVEVVKSNGGKFLERRDGCWVELDEKKSMAKAGHAIRDMIEATTTKENRKKLASVAMRKKQLTAETSTNVLCPLSVNTLPSAIESGRHERRESVDSLMLAWLADDGDFLLDTLLENFQAGS